MSSFKPNGQSSRPPQMGQRVSDSAMELATRPRPRVTATASDVGTRDHAQAAFDAFINAPADYGDGVNTFASFGREALREPASRAERAVYRLEAFARHLDSSRVLETAWTRAQRRPLDQKQTQDAPEKAPPSEPSYVANDRSADNAPQHPATQQQAEVNRPESSDGCSTLCPDDARSAAGSVNSERALQQSPPPTEAAEHNAPQQAHPSESPQASVEAEVHAEASGQEASHDPSREQAATQAQAAPQAAARRPTLDAEGNPITMDLQPDSRPISRTQLVSEVKSIYAGLAMVEAKCIEVDGNARNNYSNEQYQALHALHKTLMNEHHDFMLASQHPSASDALKRLSKKYAMPARWWKHSVHSYLEVLRHRLPDSLEYMIGFIYESMSMTMLLFETVGEHNAPALKDTYSECMGDLCRYRMAIEDEDFRVREHFRDQAQSWYAFSQNSQPRAGRLSHHLGILARGEQIKELALYGKALTAQSRFDNGEETLRQTLFSPELDEARERRDVLNELPEAFESAVEKLSVAEAFVNVQRALYAGRSKTPMFESDLQHFYATLPHEIGKSGRRYRAQGVNIALANIASVLDFGVKEGFLQQRIAPKFDDDNPIPMTLRPTSRDVKAQEIAMKTLDIALTRVADPDTAPQVHASLAFIHQTIDVPEAAALTLQRVPWVRLATYLNGLVRTNSGALFTGERFPENNSRPLPEDFELRGLSWTDTGDDATAERNYFPKEWFTDANCTNDERAFEQDGTAPQRAERILWLGVQIAKNENAMIEYDSATKRFSLKQPILSHI